MSRVLLSPHLIALHLLALLATTAAVLLGLWQYDAWQAARSAQATSLADAEPGLLANVMSSDDPYPADAVGQPVRFAGRWVDDSTLLVADRELQGSTGFWVVSPVAVCQRGCASGPAMLVVRGWTQRPQDIPAPPRGRVQVTGWLQPTEGSGRPDPSPGDDVLQELRIADALQRVDQDLFGAYVIAEHLDPGGSPDARGAPGRLEPVTPDSLPEPETFTSVRNLLYALEWWVFGAFALFLWWRWCADAVKEARSEDDVPSAGGPQGPERRIAAEPAARLLR